MRNYTRGYDDQLIGFREERARLEEAGYQDHVKVTVSALIARGENAEHIASILEIGQAVVIRWYRDLFLNQEDLVFGIDDFTYIREKNAIKADARTKGCIVKGILEQRITREEALELVAVGTIGMQTINNWVLNYSRDCDIMMTLPAGSDMVIKPAYALNRVDAEAVQQLIFQHDREENQLASRNRETVMARRI